jgi:general secretion pathway protein N
LSDNPLWAMPLAQFPVTRDRPIFSPSRRPPPAVAPAVLSKALAIPRPKEPEHPQLTLVGTIASDEEGFGIFMDQSTKAVLRLKVGEDFQGWKLRSVQGRETALEKDQQVVTLVLPQPGVGQVSVEVPPPPPSVPTLRSSESRMNRPGR